MLHSLNYLRARKLSPRGSHDNRIMIMLSDKSYTLAYFSIRHAISMAENNARGIFYLIVEKLAEIFHMHLAFACIYNGCCAVKLGAVSIGVLHRRNNVGKLANSGGLDKYPIGMIFVYYLFKRLCKVAYQGATYAT